MEFLYRVLLLLRRKYTARQFRVSFPGTTEFKFPSRIWLNGRWTQLTIPQENSLNSDFINLALDDEYGLASLPLQPASVLDVGANIGLFSLLCAARFPNARVHCYEPNIETFQFTTQNLHETNVLAINAGVGSSEGRASMRLGGDSRLASTIVDQTGEVRIVSLNEAIKNIGGSVDLLKMDCEGAEWDIFRAQEAFQHVKIIRMEYHLEAGQTVQRVLDSADSIRFRVEKIKPNAGFGIAWLSSRDAVL